MIESRLHDYNSLIGVIMSLVCRDAYKITNKINNDYNSQDAFKY